MNEPKTKVTIALPPDAAERLLEGWRRKDPKLMAMLKDLGFEVLDVKPSEPQG